MNPVQILKAFLNFFLDLFFFFLDGAETPQLLSSSSGSDVGQNKTIKLKLPTVKDEAYVFLFRFFHLLLFFLETQFVSFHWSEGEKENEFNLILRHSAETSGADTPDEIEDDNKPWFKNW